jgi:hypothetical protein
MEKFLPIERISEVLRKQKIVLLYRIELLRHYFDKFVTEASY